MIRLGDLGVLLPEQAQVLRELRQPLADGEPVSPESCEGIVLTPDVRITLDHDSYQALDRVLTALFGSE